MSPSGRADEIVFTRIPASTPFIANAEGGRIVRLSKDGKTAVLTPQFHSAADPEVSFDAEKILFAGKKSVEDRWQIYEVGVDGSNLRRITNEPYDCRQPIYQSTLFLLNSVEPWYQLAFVGGKGAGNLYTARLDGSEIRPVTFHPFGIRDPHMVWDGRMIFAARQLGLMEGRFPDRTALFGVNLDGTDFELFAGDDGGRIKRMPAQTDLWRVVFVESDASDPDGAGTLASVSMRRPLRSYEALTRRSAGLFHSPSPVTGGEVLVSRKRRGTYGLWRFNPERRSFKRIGEEKSFHRIQAKILAPRRVPDGRSSVVEEDAGVTGQLYALNPYIDDLPDRAWLPPGTIRRLRVLEGIPPDSETLEPSDLGVRFLGEFDVEEDGSFNMRVPSNIPIRLQTLDAEGMALRSCTWIWVRNREARGCIGCHEDGELVPENVLAQAFDRKQVDLTLPPQRRRTVDFARDVKPILASRCSTVGCHAEGFRDLGRLVTPGAARTSPLVWHLFGRNTSRPWDTGGSAPQSILRPCPGAVEAVSAEERRRIVEWIDLGAREDR